VVGGLGLGYTARAVLDDPRVGSLTVIDAIEEVIVWHRTGLLPLGPGLSGDPRCRLIHGDFFAMAQAPPTRLLHAVLVDIDHAPGHVLHPGHQPFYTPDGLRALAAHLRPGGVFGLWSDDPPDQWFLGNLEQVFSSAQAHVVTFPNPLRGGTSANTVYLARSALA
jgi:spermidine synthase